MTSLPLLTAERTMRHASKQSYQWTTVEKTDRKMVIKTRKKERTVGREEKRENIVQERKKKSLIHSK